MEQILDLWITAPSSRGEIIKTLIADCFLQGIHSEYLGTDEIYKRLELYPGNDTTLWAIRMQLFSKNKEVFKKRQLKKLLITLST